MTTPPRRAAPSMSSTGPSGDWDVLIAVVAGAAAWVIGGVWAATRIAALVAHGRSPQLSLRDTVRATGHLASHLGDPAGGYPPAMRARLAGPTVFWPVLVIVWVVSGSLVYEAWRRWQQRRRSGDGYAPPAAVRRVLGAAAAKSTASQLRPSLKGRVRPNQVAVAIGRAHRTRCWLPVEESALLVAPPRAGKSSQVIIPTLWDWPGPALITSTKVDVLAATHQRRAEKGRPLWVLDPSGITGLKSAGWNLVSGCGDVRVAQARATTMVAAMGSSEGVEDGRYWAGEGASLLACWLIAAAVTGGDATDVWRWAVNQQDPDPAERLAAAGLSDVARQLRQFQALDPKPRGGIWAMAMTPLRALLQPAVRAMFAPAAGDGLDLDQWRATGGTIYLVGDESPHSPALGLLTAFVDATIEHLKRVAQRSPHGRLDPPVALLLDEVANVAPLPQIPALMSVAGGHGIFLVAVVQTIAQAEARWGSLGARQLIGGATAKLFLTGISDPQELDQWAGMLGEVDEHVAGWSTNERGVSRSMSVRRRPLLDPAGLRTDLAPSEALLVHRGLLPVRLHQRRAHQGRHAKPMRRANQALLAQMRHEP